MTRNRVLLVNPPVVDLRVPWAEWVEPTGLLKVARVLQEQGTDVRLLDCFRTAPKQRERDAVVYRDGQPLNRWRFGLRRGAIVAALRHWREEGWTPDQALVTCLASHWWLGVPLVVECIRRVFPDTEVILGGRYSEEAPHHALHHAGVSGVAGDALRQTAIYAKPLYDVQVGGYLHCAVSSIMEVGIEGTLGTVAEAAARGSTRFLVADHGIAGRAPGVLERFLTRLSGVCPKARLFVLGTVSAAEIVQWSELPSLFRAARCRQLVLADNRDYPVGSEGWAAFVGDVERATTKVLGAGYRFGTDDYAVEVCVGRPGETPEEIAEKLPLLAHVAGSVIAVPYQPAVSEGGAEDPWEANGKLFPFAERNGSSFMAYMELLGLCALLNSKYRSHTFDFLGEDSMIARSLRRSLRQRAWDPSVAPTLPELRVIQPGEGEVA